MKMLNTKLILKKKIDFNLLIVYVYVLYKPNKNNEKRMAFFSENI